MELLRVLEWGRDVGDVVAPGVLFIMLDCAEKGIEPPGTNDIATILRRQKASVIAARRLLIELGLLDEELIPTDASLDLVGATHAVRRKVSSQRNQRGSDGNQGEQAEGRLSSHENPEGLEGDSGSSHENPEVAEVSSDGNATIPQERPTNGTLGRRRGHSPTYIFDPQHVAREDLTTKIGQLKSKRRETPDELTPADIVELVALRLVFWGRRSTVNFNRYCPQAAMLGRGEEKGLAGVFDVYAKPDADKSAYPWSKGFGAAFSDGGYDALKGSVTGRLEVEDEAVYDNAVRRAASQEQGEHGRTTRRLDKRGLW